MRLRTIKPNNGKSAFQRALVLALLLGNCMESAAQERSSTVSSFEELTGWWRFSDSQSGCNDADNQYRVALGRWQIHDGVVEFGAGELGVGMYDAGCEVSDFTYQPDAIGMMAQCYSEGETYRGFASIQIRGSEMISMTLPMSPREIDPIHCPAEGSDLPTTNASALSACLESVDHSAFKNSQWQDCYAAALAGEDQRLNAAYRDTQQKNEGQPGFPETLIEAQRRWISFRDAWCGFEKHLDLVPSGEINYLACLYSLTSQQAERLESVSAGQ